MVKLPRQPWMSWLLVIIVALVGIGATGLFISRRRHSLTPTPTSEPTTAVAVGDVESPTPTTSHTPSLTETPSQTPTITLSPPVTETPDYVAAAKTVAAQATLDFQNARAGETIAAATLYSEQTATQTALYEQQTGAFQVSANEINYKEGEKKGE